MPPVWYRRSKYANNRPSPWRIYRKNPTTEKQIEKFPRDFSGWHQMSKFNLWVENQISRDDWLMPPLLLRERNSSVIFDITRHYHVEAISIALSVLWMDVTFSGKRLSRITQWGRGEKACGPKQMTLLMRCFDIDQIVFSRVTKAGKINGTCPCLASSFQIIIARSWLLPANDHFSHVVCNKDLG